MELQGKKCSCFPHVIKLIRVQGCLPGSGCKHGAAASLAQICLQPVWLCLHETCCCCCCFMGLLIPLPPPSQCYGCTQQGQESSGLHTALLGPWGLRGEQQICTKTLTGVCSVICSPPEQHSERDSTDKAVPLAPETHGAAGTWQYVTNVLSATGMANVLGHQVPVVHTNLQVSAACSSLQTKTLSWHLPEPGFP